MPFAARLATLLLALFVALPAAAQAPHLRTLRVQFNGVITNDVADTISIRQPDGTLTPYEGPVPTYAYKKGDPVTISFSTIVPTSAYYDANTVPRAADGIYRFALAGPNGNGNEIAVARNFDISGPLAPSTDFGVGGITIVYDANADTYSLEFPRGNYAASYFSGPSYKYDGTTGALVSSPFNCFGGSCTDGATLTGNATGGTIRNQVGDASFPSIAGFFSLLFSGSWSLPTYESGSSGGGPTQVPEPGSMLLFAGGAAWLVRRAKRARKAV